MCFVLVIRPVLRPKGYERPPGPARRFRMKLWSWLHRNHPRPNAIEACREALSPTRHSSLYYAEELEDNTTIGPPPYDPDIIVLEDRV